MPFRRHAFIASILAVLASCQEPKTPVTHWQTEIAFQAPAKLGGCAIGNVDRRYPGNEICTVSVTGEVFVVHRDRGKWTSERVFKAPGEMLQCVAMDLDPQTDGDEILAVGMASGTEEDGGEGAAYVIRRTESGWVGEKAFVDTALIHGCCASEHGAILVGFSKTVHLLTREADAWKTERIARLSGNGKTAVAAQHGIVVACSDGKLIIVAKKNGTWDQGVLSIRKAGRSRLGSDGVRVLSSDDDGALVLVGKGGESTVIHREGMKLRGAVLADLDPWVPGLEAACVGYECKLTVLYEDKKMATWKPRTLLRETLKFHHLGSGQIGMGKTTELVACGYAGRLVVLRLVRL